MEKEMKIIVETEQYNNYKKAMEIQKEYDEIIKKVYEFENKLNDILFEIVNE